MDLSHIYIYISIRQSENLITTESFHSRFLIYGGMFHCWRGLSLQYGSCVWTNGLLNCFKRNVGLSKAVLFLGNDTECFRTNLYHINGCQIVAE
jgi:hypothetical protein